jgi:small ligand-binding sensory domain FIST
VRGAVAIGDVLPPGAEIALATRDPAYARNELVAKISAISRSRAGSAPAAGLMFTCAGRGARFYGRQDVDAGIVRKHLAAIPMAGMQSAFELAPWRGSTRVHLYTASCAVFHRLS